jgi:hypothetical protein
MMKKGIYTEKSSFDFKFQIPTARLESEILGI